MRTGSSGDQITKAAKPYSAETLKKIQIQYINSLKKDGTWQLNLILSNNSNENISARSESDTPLRLSWRFLDVNGTPRGGWDNRKDLTRDIRANSKSDATIFFEENVCKNGESLQLAFVEENLFWSFDIGVPVINIPCE